MDIIGHSYMVKSATTESARKQRLRFNVSGVPRGTAGSPMSFGREADEDHRVLSALLRLYPDLAGVAACLLRKFLI